MSTTTFPTTHALAVKVWEKTLFNDAVKGTLYGQLTGASDRAVVQVKDVLKKSDGDKITFGLRALPTGTGVQDDETLEGNEEGLDFKDYSIYLGEKRHAVKVDLNLSEQRTMIDVRAEAKVAIGEWTEEYIDTTFFEFLTGSGQGATTLISKYHPRSGSGLSLGGNALTAPSANRIVYGGVGIVAKNARTATDTMSFSVLDKIAERCKLATPTMRKAQYNGKSCWVVIMHPYQVNDLRANTGNLQWGDIVKAEISGGGQNKFEGEILGMYREMLLIESTRIPTFSDYGAGSNVKAARALVLGAQAAVVAHGKKTDKDGKMSLVERTFDYGKRYGVAITMIWGMGKTKFTSQDDFGVFAVDTAAAPHN